jgi:hypothetical protein
MENKKCLKPPTSYGFESNYSGRVMELSWDSKRGSTVKISGYWLLVSGFKHQKKQKTYCT